MQAALHYLTLAQEQRIEELKQLRRICELMDVISSLVHCLQSERGSSNVFLASQGLKFREKWIDFSSKSMEAARSLHDWLKANERLDALVGGSRISVRLALVVYEINELSPLREKVLRLEISPAQSTSVYSSVVNALLSLVFDVADIAVDPTVSKELVALFHLMQGKEFAGLERATGARICASSKSPELLETLGNLIELQEYCIERFDAFSAKDVHNQWLVLTKKMPNIEIEQMRRKLLSPKLVDQSIDADIWFDLCTRRINDMHVVEKYLANNLAKKCDVLISKTLSEFKDQKVLLSILSKEQPSSPVSLLVANLSPLNDANDKAMVGKIGSGLFMEILDVLQSQSQQLKLMSEELLAVRATLDERKIIERAKGILMAHQGLSEERAYSVMREKAMSQNQKIIDIAHSILSLSEFLKLKH